MPRRIETPVRVAAAGSRPKLIDEFIGRISTGEARLSVAHMRSPGGWTEPGQRPVCLAAFSPSTVHRDL